MNPETADFDYYLFGTRVRLADGCAGKLAETVAELGCARPVMLMQARLAASPEGQAVHGALKGLACLLIDDVPTHGSVRHIEALLPAVQAHGPDCLIAVGGGSVADSAKALALLLAEGGRLADLATRFTPPDKLWTPRLVRPKLPIIALPATASAAEATPSVGLAEGDHKLLFWCRDLAATEILIDPELAGMLPDPLLLATAVNGVAHSLEGLYSRRSSPASDALATQSLALFAAALDASAPPGRRERLRKILVGAHLSGMVLSMARTCLHHAICHVIGARQRVGHGAANCVMLPHVLRFNAEAAAPAMRQALRAINQEASTPWQDVAEWVESVRQAHALPATLAELGITQDDLPALAEQVMGERGLAVNPRPVADAGTVLRLLERALTSPSA